MVAPVSSINQYLPNREILEVVRRLQSLGLSSSGNLSIDRQRLQAAELKKKQITLATNSEPSLNKLQGTDADFSSTFNNVQSINGVGARDNQNGLISVKDTQFEQIPVRNNTKYEMAGALQLAKLNKFRLGLTA